MNVEAPSPDLLETLTVLQEFHAMTVPSGVRTERFLHEQFEQASWDLLRQMRPTVMDAFMSVEADAVCGAEYGFRSTERANTRNG